MEAAGRASMLFCVYILAHNTAHALLSPCAIIIPPLTSLYPKGGSHDSCLAALRCAVSGQFANAAKTDHRK
jgi:hypothetical protein